MKQTETLPDHPGDLIRLAVLDLVATAQDTEHFEIDMSDWFNPDIGKCGVCFAGAVMAQSLHVDRTEYMEPEDFDHDSRRKFYALNSFRVGDVGWAYHWLDRALPPMLPSSILVASWHDNKDQFIADMLDLAAMIDNAEAAHVN